MLGIVFVGFAENDERTKLYAFIKRPHLAHVTRTGQC